MESAGAAYISELGLWLFVQLARVNPALEACSASIASRSAAGHSCRRRETEIPLSLTLLLRYSLTAKKKNVSHLMGGRFKKK